MCGSRHRNTFPTPLLELYRQWGFRIAENLGRCADPQSDTYFALSLTLFLAMAAASMASAAYVASAAYMAAPITHLVSVEVIEGLISTRRMWTSVAMMWIEAVIHVAVEVVGAVEPRAGSDEHAAVEPLGSVVPVWRAA